MPARTGFDGKELIANELAFSATWQLTDVKLHGWPSAGCSHPNQKGHGWINETAAASC
jgi:hypothetical protein